jgi:RNA polymerase sigma factor (sigma-70 family)
MANDLGRPATACPPVGGLPERTDRELLAEYRASRSHEAFARLARRHGGMVFRTCRRLLPTIQDAEDATQAVFLLLAQKPEKAADDLPGWLHVVARNTALMVLRSGKSRALRERRAAEMRGAMEVPKEPGLKEELDAGLGRLPAALRSAVILCHLEGHNQEEAARIAGCDRSTVSRRAADGLERLRAMLLRRGTVVTPVVLAGFLAGEAAAAVPAALVSALAAPQVVAGGALATGSAAALLAKATVQSMFWAKIKVAALQMAGVLLVAAVPAYLVLKPTGPVPVGSYAFDEGSGTRVTDASGSGNHGTLVGGVTWTAGRRPGSKALRFDGQTGHVKVAQDLNQWLGNTATVAFWINTTQIGDSETWRTPAVLGANVRGTDKDILWALLDNRGRIGVDDDVPVWSTRPINDGTWHHVALTRDAARGEITIYVDGAFNAQAASRAGTKVTPFFTIGRIDNASRKELYFQGSLSDLKLYRGVLSAEEIRKLAE